MKLTEFGVGKITAQNTTKDVKPGETERQAKKLGLGGKPKLLHKTAAKNSDPNTLFNLGIGEGKRIPRKKGQPAGSKKHSDLYTDENPRGTIHGLKFATVKDAEASVNKIKSSGKSHAHKIQAAVAMEQRAKAAGKKSAAAVYRKYINAMKKKTKKMNELRIEKPDPKDTLGIERKYMPQIKSDDYEEFIEFLTQNGVKFRQETIPARELQAMQKQFSDKGILKQLEKNIAQGPNTKAVIASSDDYILDGHHRWLVAVNTGTDLNVYRVNMPAWRLYDLVNKFQKVYYKDIYDEGKPTIGVPLSSGLVVSIFPHRPLKIKPSTPGKLRYDEDNSSIGAQINFPGFKKDDKTKPKPKYNPIPKKDRGVLDKIKGFFEGEGITEGYMLRLENTDDQLVLHVKNTKTGERMEVRGKPNYEIDYDPNDELHQLLDVIGKASNISELMNGEVVNVNPKHPDGPRSYKALHDLMHEDLHAWFKEKWGIEEGSEITMWTNPEYQGSDVDDEYYNKQPAKLIDVNKLTPFEPADKMDDEISAANMNKLVKAIQAGQKINPIVVVPHKGELLIIDGHHRYFATIKAGVDKIRAVMADPKDLTWRDDVPVQEAQVEEGVNDPHIFKAVFLAGGPGSGKSFVAQALLGGTGLRSVNSDEIYEYLMKKQGLSLDPATIFSPQGQEIRDKAKDLSRKRERTYLDGRIGLIIDGTGKDVNKYKVMAEKLRAIGYDLSMIYVNTSLEVAQQRNRQRERSLAPAKVEQMWNEVQQNLMKFQQIFGAGRFHILDNSGGLEDLDRQKNFDKVYNETQRFLNTPPSKRKALAWIQQQKEQNDEKRSATQPTNSQPNGGTSATN